MGRSTWTRVTVLALAVVLVAGTFAAIRHANAETSQNRSAHLAQIILDGLRPRPR